jgi:NhaP-type Na+/H+ or K+/H+ antiporter
VEWALAATAAALLLVAALSRSLTGTPVTAAMVVVALGLLLGPKALDVIDPPSGGSAVRTLAEAALSLVLFCDASRIDLRALRRDLGVPARLLGIGLPLTIGLGALVAIVVFNQLTLGEALILGIVLAPTDAALGQAVVEEPIVPARIREALNVESGLNDGICVPLLFAAVAAADVESDIAHGQHALTLLAEEIGYGVLGGAIGALAAAAVVIFAGRRKLITPAWMPVVPLAGAGLAYGVAAPLHGSGFIAAFVAGAAFRALIREDPAEMNVLAEDLGNVLSAVTFLLFGAILLGPALGDVTWEVVLYALLSLTLVRMLPVAVAMVGARARLPTIGFLGWFGPRGLASIVFAVIVVEESNLPEQNTLLLAVYLTVGLSVFLHGATAAPLARRYGRWYSAHPEHRRPEMESVPSVVTRTRRRGAPAP